MTERNSGQKRRTWTVLFAAAVVLIAIGVGWRAFSSPGSAPPEKSQGRPAKAQRLSDDLVGISDANYASLDGLAPGSREAQERQRQAVQQLGLPLEVKARKTGIVLRLVPAGSFTMGSPTSESGRVDDEIQHQVILNRAFYCAKFEVTQVQWEALMGSNPSSHKRGVYVGGYALSSPTDDPVEQVSWEDCQEFLKKLCQMEGAAEGTYRLLTEAEWEYACRAGSAGRYYFSDRDSALGQYAWYSDNGDAATHPVGQKKANAFGLYDMHGNVEEWCQDWYGVYPSGSVTNPSGPRSSGDNLRVIRGGSWCDTVGRCRSAFRGRGTTEFRWASNGLRLARTIPSYP
jgi:formylglycine-generating enzyme required for sulfatase activity